MSNPDTVAAGARTQSKIIVAESKGHGKNVKGGKRTSTFQVRHYCLADPKDFLLKKQFSFMVDDRYDRSKAFSKASAYAEKLRLELESKTKGAK
jgi:hypothetical protein